MAKQRTLGLGDADIQQLGAMKALASIARVIRSPDEFETRPLLNGSSGADMNVNGSITPVTFRYTAIVDTLVTRIQGAIVDTDIEVTKFGGIPALANGITMQADNSDDTILADLIPGGIQANWQFSLFSVVSTEITLGATEDLFEFGIDLAGSGTTLLLRTGQYIDLTVNDDLTGLSEMRVAVLGYTVETKAADILRLTTGQ